MEVNKNMKHVGVIEDEWVKKFNRLVEILNTMSVPKKKIIEENIDYGWLLRNLHAQNAYHEDYKEAMKLLREVSGYKARRNRD